MTNTVGLSYVFRWLSQRLKQRTARQIERDRVVVEAFRKRLATPDFELVLRRFGAPISEPLRKLYSDLTTLNRECFAKTCRNNHHESFFIAWYIPLDEQAYSEQWHCDDGRLDFADDGTASRYTIDPTDDEAEIFYFRHEDQSLHPTGVRLSDFLELPEA